MVECDADSPAVIRQFEGIQLHVEHIGFGVLREWSQQLEKAKMMDLKEIEENGQDPNIYSPNRQAAAKNILKTTVHGMRYDDNEVVEGAVAVVDEIVRIGAYEFALNAAMGVQSLKPAHIFTEGPGDVV